MIFAHTSVTHVAVGIVHNDAGQVLFAQRPAGKPYAGWWEFPGGKIEGDETVAQALARELREELGIQILDCQPWLTQRFVYPHAHVNLQFCHVRSFSGQVQSLEGQAFAWGTAQHPPLPFLPAALPVIKAMQLPEWLYATQGLAGLAVFLQSLGSGVVIVDEPKLSPSAALAVLNTCLAWRANTSKAQRRTVLLASHHPAAWRGLADGVCLSAADLVACQQRPSYEWVLAEAQTKEAIAQAAQLGVNAVCVNAHAGWGALGDALDGAQVACYASGELEAQHLPFAKAAGAVGLAMKIPL